MTVPTTFLAVHGILLEERVEHIQGKDLRVEVTVVACIISADKMANVGVTVAPVTIDIVSIISKRARSNGKNLHSLSYILRPFDARNVVSQLIPELSAVQVLDFIVGLGAVDSHIKCANEDLSKGSRGRVEMLGLN